MYSCLSSAVLGLRYNTNMEMVSGKDCVSSEYEALIRSVCRKTGAVLEFTEKDDTVLAELHNDMSFPISYNVKTLPKTSREDACLSIIRSLLFPEVAKIIGVPAASSIAELRLKIEITGPS